MRALETSPRLMGFVLAEASPYPDQSISFAQVSTTCPFYLCLSAFTFIKLLCFFEL
jgi:hypothetical protein